jgi:ribosomal-protein-alanine N-acetyltransferase
MDIPSYNTHRLILRGFTPADINLLDEIVSDPDVVRYFPLSTPWPRDITQKWVEKHWSHWEQHKFGWWALIYRETSKLLGWCGLGQLEETGEIEVLYLLDKSHWGMGLATEAAQFSIDYAFQVLNLDVVIGLTHPNNIASQKVLQKIGLAFNKEAKYFGMDLYKFSIDKHTYQADQSSKDQP